MEKIKLIATDNNSKRWNESDYYFIKHTIWEETMPDCDYIIEDILKKRLKPDETKIELETIKEIIESLKNNIHLADEFTSHEWLNAIRAFQKAEKIILTYKLNIHCLDYYIF